MTTSYHGQVHMTRCTPATCAHNTYLGLLAPLDALGAWFNNDFIRYSGHIKRSTLD